MSERVGLFEEVIEPLREDGVHLRALRITPDFDDAERCHGAGVVVLVAEDGDRDAALERLARPLAKAGYFVVAHALAADPADLAAGIEDLEAALLSLKDLARGKLGVIGLGAAAGVALAAAAELPHLDAVVHAGAGVPATVRLRRTRAAILVHRAAHGTALADAEVTALIERLRPSRAPLTLRNHDAPDGFFLADSTEGRIAREQTQQFFDLVLT